MQNMGKNETDGGREREREGAFLAVKFFGGELVGGTYLNTKTLM
jgi:hypothetical protein